ncbi:hypothetical protein A0H81_09055 [Grifola frondosa]|uniref:Uncharacterized protein n=1 Tax=Grifola frondosa TaxID=5627 RepID=A0A1C7M3A5_GRIFR|nr:hypothetical protein A0H81_09055 [Grifola frondosa]
MRSRDSSRRHGRVDRRLTAHLNAREEPYNEIPAGLDALVSGIYARCRTEDISGTYRSTVMVIEGVKLLSAALLKPTAGLMSYRCNHKEVLKQLQI